MDDLGVPPFQETAICCFFEAGQHFELLMQLLIGLVFGTLRDLRNLLLQQPGVGAPPKGGCVFFAEDDDQTK